MNIPWKLKSRIFRTIDFLSAPNILYFLQKHVTKRSRIKALEINENWIRHSQSLKKYGATSLVFEFGAGKSLAQNLVLSELVTTQWVVDLNPMIDIDSVEICRKLLAGKIKFKSDKSITSVDDLILYGINYAAPYDAADTHFGALTIDGCISTNTLEHIPKDSIERIFNELHRTLKPSGIISAKIDYSDHYAHTDHSISLLNFLQFNESEWKIFNHRCHYQNRLRHYDYVDIFVRTGFEIIEEEIGFGEENIPKIICNKFEGKDKTWSATSAYFILRKRSERFV